MSFNVEEEEAEAEEGNRGVGDARSRKKALAECRLLQHASLAGPRYIS